MSRPSAAERASVEERIRDARVWLAAIEAQVIAVATNGGYGELRVEFLGGTIKRAVLERSVVNPEVLARLVE